MTKNIAFIGLGKQNTKDHLLAAQNNPHVRIVAVCDNDLSVATELGKEIGVPGYSTVQDMLKNHTIDAAVVAVPHFAYLPILTTLMQAGVHILKEKPFAMNLEEAQAMAELADKYQVNLSVAVQRKHNKVFQSYLDYAPRIGEIFSIHGEYTLNIGRLDEGWRASKDLAGGGAVIDMGYHLLDLIIWYFGMPDRISADLGYQNRTGQDYDVEDTAKIQFSYLRGERKILGSLLLSRIYPQKDEGLFIYGAKGAVKLFKNKIELFDDERELIESKFIRPDGSDISLQFDTFIKSLDLDNYKGNYKDHLMDMVLIDAIYRSDAEAAMICPHDDERYTGLLEGKEAKVLQS